MNPATSLNKKLTTVAALGMVGVTLYWTFTYTGPYRYLAELQIKWFGSYVPKLTVLLIILGFLGIAGVIKLILRGAERPVPGLPAASLPKPVSVAPLPQAPQMWLQYIRFIAPLVVAGFGAWAYFNGTQAGSLRELSANDFQNGGLHSRIVYADVRGHLSGTYLGQDHYLYIPMFAEKNSDAPVQLLVGVDENQTSTYLRREADGSFTVRGVADKGLAGDVKYAFEKNGIAVADPVWVVHAGREPSGDKKFGLIMIAIGIAGAALLQVLNSLRNRKNTPPPLQARA